jgi:hypothetical protein
MSQNSRRMRAPSAPRRSPTDPSEKIAKLGWRLSVTFPSEVSRGGVRAWFVSDRTIASAFYFLL